MHRELSRFSTNMNVGSFGDGPGTYAGKIKEIGQMTSPHAASRAMWTPGDAGGSTSASGALTSIIKAFHF